MPGRILPRSSFRRSPCRVAEGSRSGKWIAFETGEEKKYSAYAMQRLALVPADGGSQPTLVKAAADLDRGVSAPRFTADGSAIEFLVTDDRSVYPARVRLTGGASEKAEKL